VNAHSEKSRQISGSTRRRAIGRRVRAKSLIFYLNSSIKHQPAASKPKASSKRKASSQEVEKGKRKPFLLETNERRAAKGRVNKSETTDHRKRGRGREADLKRSSQNLRFVVPFLFRKSKNVVG